MVAFRQKMCSRWIVREDLKFKKELLLHFKIMQRIDRLIKEKRERERERERNLRLVKLYIFLTVDDKTMT